LVTWARSVPSRARLLVNWRRCGRLAYGQPVHRDTSCHGKTVAALVQRRLRPPMRHYEIMIILDSNLEERTVQPSLDQFLTVVTGGGGKVDKVDIWGKRRLSYPIEKKPEGIYAVVDLTAEPATVSELDRQLNLNEAVLRTKVMRPEHR
jgi:small subunit ribosomal protein S6